MQVDAFLALKRDGSVIVYSGKVDLGTGHRIAMRQMVAEELDIGGRSHRADRGRHRAHAGPGADRRQHRRDARRRATAASGGHGAPGCWLHCAAQRLSRPADALKLANGVVISTDGKANISVADLYGGEPFGVAMDPKAPLKKPADYRIVGRSLPRPDLPDKLNGSHTFVHDIRVPDMLHGRALRPPAVGAKPLDVDEKSIAHLKGGACHPVERLRRGRRRRRMDGGTCRARAEGALVAGRGARWQRRRARQLASWPVRARRHAEERWGHVAARCERGRIALRHLFLAGAIARIDGTVVRGRRRAARRRDRVDRVASDAPLPGCLRAHARLAEREGAR